MAHQGPERMMSYVAAHPAQPLCPAVLPRRRSAVWACLLGVVLAPASAPVWAAAPTTADPVYLHTVARGDTLIGLGRKLLVQPAQWPEVARLNGMKAPNHMPVGKVLRIPLRLMAVEGEPAVITAVNGDARAASKAGEAAVVVGQAIPEGTELRTGDGNVTVRLVDGTVLRLRAASRLQIDESHRVPRAGVVRSGVSLQQGQIEVQAKPAAAGQPGFRVGTPQGVLGVRGTEFRVNAEAASSVTRGEVLEGLVAATGPAGRAGVVAAAPPGQLVKAGYGVVVDREGRVAPPVLLLAAPSVAQLPALQDRPLVRFALPAVAGAASYRGQVAREAGFDLVLAEVQSASNDLRIANLPDGDYVLRVRAVDANGLQGQNADHAFRLKARPEPPLPQAPAPRAVIPGDRVDLAWTVNPEARSYRLQLSGSADFSQPVRDLSGQTAGSLPLTGLAPGTYYWRVASERSATDQGPFGPVNQFELRLVPPPPPPPAAPQASVNDQSLRLAWEGAPGQSFDVELARDLAFANVWLQRRVQSPSLELEMPGTGRFYVRVRTRDADGFVSPYSTPQQVDVPNCLRAASGACVRAEGTPVLIGP